MLCKFEIRGSYPTGAYFLARVAKPRCELICLREPHTLVTPLTPNALGKVHLCSNITRCKHIDLLDLAEQLKNYGVQNG